MPPLEVRETKGSGSCVLTHTPERVIFSRSKEGKEWWACDTYTVSVRKNLGGLVQPPPFPHVVEAYKMRMFFTSVIQPLLEPMKPINTQARVLSTTPLKTMALFPYL